MQKKRTALLTLAGACGVYAAMGRDNKLRETRYTLRSDKLTRSVRLVQLSDLHGRFFGKNQGALLAALQRLQPDLLLFTGDIFDNTLPPDGALRLLQALAGRWPGCYVCGNHEYRLPDVCYPKALFQKHGFHVLDGESITLQLQGQPIQICGVDDPDSGLPYSRQLAAAFRKTDPALFTVLLAHRPEYSRLYADFPCDVIFSGHAHGGQWRLPFGKAQNGLFAPHQGIFPRFSGGQIQYESSAHIISRGLSNGSEPLPRLFNPPELVVVDVLP